MKIQANLPGIPFRAMETAGQIKDAGKGQTVNKLPEGMGNPGVKLTISREGMDAYRRMTAEKEESSKGMSLEEVKNSTIHMEQVYGSISSSVRYFATEEEVLEGRDMTKNIVSLWFSREVDGLKESQGGNTWRDRAARLAQAYTTLYDEIVQGYENGTREVRVVEEGATVSDLAQGRGYRVLTMEEELAQLDRVYEKQVNQLERQAKEWPKQLEILCRIDESRSSKMGRERYYTEEKVKELEDDYKTVPDNLAERMITVRDIWKSAGLNLSKGQAWENVVEMINTMFRPR